MIHEVLSVNVCFGQFILFALTVFAGTPFECQLTKFWYNFNSAAILGLGLILGMSV